MNNSRKSGTMNILMVSNVIDTETQMELNEMNSSRQSFEKTGTV